MRPGERNSMNSWGADDTLRAPHRDVLAQLDTAAQVRGPFSGKQTWPVNVGRANTTTACSQVVAANRHLRVHYVGAVRISEPREGRRDAPIAGITHSSPVYAGDTRLAICAVAACARVPRGGRHTMAARPDVWGHRQRRRGGRAPVTAVIGGRTL